MKKLEGNILKPVIHGSIVLILAMLNFAVIPITIAREMPSPDELEQSLKGSWSGALVYRDYQTGTKFELPMTAQIEVGPDNATITRLSAFDDGPITGLVYISTISLFNSNGNLSTNAFFRKGRAVEVWTDDAKVSWYKDALHWTIVYQRKGNDDDKPAEIRVTQTLDGKELTVLKEVKSAGAADREYQFRNNTRLTRK